MNRAKVEAAVRDRFRRPYLAIAFGIELQLTPTDEGGRSAPLFNLADHTWAYRPNWGLPSMVPPAQTGAPVLAISRDRVEPGESAHTVIVTVFPEMVDQWNLEVVPGVVLPMYEGPTVRGYGTVLWRENVILPLPQADAQRLLRRLHDPNMPLSQD